MVMVCGVQMPVFCLNRGNNKKIQLKKFSNSKYSENRKTLSNVLNNKNTDNDAKNQIYINQINDNNEQSYNNTAIVNDKLFITNDTKDNVRKIKIRNKNNNKDVKINVDDKRKILFHVDNMKKNNIKKIRIKIKKDNTKNSESVVEKTINKISEKDELKTKDNKNINNSHNLSLDNTKKNVMVNNKKSDFSLKDVKDHKNNVYDKEDIIDPQYEIIKSNRRYQYKLDGELLFTRNHILGKYKNVKTREISDYLPAADSKYEIKKEQNGDLFYYYNGRKAYKINIVADRIYYENVQFNDFVFVSKKGTREYTLQKTGEKFKYLLEPDSDLILIRSGNIRNKSALYLNLCQKSEQFKNLEQQKFDKLCNKKQSIYDFMKYDNLAIMDNIINNFSRKDFEYKFIDKDRFEDYEKLNTEKEKDCTNYISFDSVTKLSRKILNNIKNLLSTPEKYEPKNKKNIVDPIYKVINKGEISFYVLDGSLKFYKLNGVKGFYDLLGHFYSTLPSPNIECEYLDLREENGKTYYCDPQTEEKRYEVVEDDGLVWFLRRDDNFNYANYYYIKGKNLKCNYKYIMVDKKNNGLTWYDTERLYKKKITDGRIQNTIEDPHYEVIEDSGTKIFYFEGFPKYVKVKDGYLRISDSKFYKNLPIAYNTEDYQLTMKKDKMYIKLSNGIKNRPIFVTNYISNAPEIEPVYELREETILKDGEPRKVLVYSIGDEDLFYSFKGEKGFYIFKNNNAYVSMDDVKFKFFPHFKRNR